jgi:hypothetical protein
MPLLRLHRFVTGKRRGACPDGPRAHVAGPANRSVIPGLPNVVRTRDVAISTGLTGRLYTPSNITASLPV